MRIAGYFHEIDDWCHAESYPLHVERLNHAEAEERLRGGFDCSSRFEARAIILGLGTARVCTPRALGQDDELLLLQDWQGGPATRGRSWWCVKRWSA